MSAAAVQHLLAIPYKLGGRDREGMDCLGIVLEGLRALGMPAEDPGDRLAKRFAEGWREFRDGVPADWKREHLADTRAGDLLLIERRGVEDHCALDLGDGYLLVADRTGSHLVRRDRVKAASRWRRSA